MFVILDDSRGAALTLAAARSATRPVSSKPGIKPMPRVATVLAQVIGDHGDAVEISFPDAIAKTHCTPLMPEGPPTTSNWFVKKQFLVPLLSKPFHKVWPDGTELSLAPGLPLSRGFRADGPLTVYKSGVPHVAVPASHISLGYWPEKPPDVSVPKSGGPARFTGTVGGEDVELFAPGDTTVGSLVAQHRECLRLVARVTAAKSGAMGGFGEAWRRFPAGTPITDPSGAPITKLRADWTVRWTFPAQAERYCPNSDPRDFSPFAVTFCVPFAAGKPEHQGPFPHGTIRY